MKIDHVTMAGSNLGEMEAAFENLGMKPDYGGPHSNGITHMALLGFDDGSYIELISAMKPGTPAPMWSKQIAGNGGPCAWAVRVEDIRGEVARIKKLGIAVTDPEDYSRRRPDGVLVEWQLAFIGDKEPGATLPFLIWDRTPREYRVKPSPSISQKNAENGSSRLSGLQRVILGVSDLEKEIRLFQNVFGWGAPKRSDDCLEGAYVAEFEGTPVALASPRGISDGWLRKRLNQFGDSPCAFLIGTSNIRETARQRGLADVHGWFQHEVAWIPSAKLKGAMLGFIQ